MISPIPPLSQNVLDPILAQIKAMPVIKAQHNDIGEYSGSEEFSLIAQMEASHSPVEVHFIADNMLFNNHPHSQALTFDGLEALTQNHYKGGALTKALDLQAPLPLRGEMRLNLTDIEQQTLTQLNQTFEQEYTTHPFLARLKPFLPIQEIQELTTNPFRWRQPIEFSAQWFDEAVRDLRQYVLKHLKP
jgi:hypothetical protein